MLKLLYEKRCFEMKRISCLYRVSTKKQVDKNKDDIPMQKTACHKFAEEKGWSIVNEVYEKGVSGFKVSAEKRDAIQDLKESAANKEFDVLLVYMFDRLGRIDSETPFVVQWFVEHGIEVWSTQEGQQKLDDQADKLINYIRYWQANGESKKTSMRLKTVMSQMTADGIYRGGPTPFGYKTVYNGRTNKKGQPVHDLQIDIEEANIIREIFGKTINEGYGSFRLAEYVNSLGVRTHTGAKFQSNTVNRILKNKMYCGYYITEDAISPKLDNLVIIDENDYNAVQYILEQRAKKNDEKRHIAMTTKGKSLLSGNIFCGHCGGTLVYSERKENYKRKDGTIGTSTYLRYTCYHKTRRLNNCDGQSIYMAYKIDNMVLEIVKSYLERIKVTPKDKALERYYETQIAENKKLHNELKKKSENLEHKLNELAIEVAKTITGESLFTADVLSMSINAVKEEKTKTDERIKICEKELQSQDDVLNSLDYHYDKFVSWADEFDNMTQEQQKMIICQLIKSIKVFKGYRLEIEFNISYNQFLKADV